MISVGSPGLPWREQYKGEWSDPPVFVVYGLGVRAGDLYRITLVSGPVMQRGLPEALDRPPIPTGGTV